VPMVPSQVFQLASIARQADDDHERYGRAPEGGA
jgi:hypothetical protein